MEHDLESIIIPLDDVADGDFDNRCLLRQIIYRLERMEFSMSVLSDAVAAVKVRVDEDFARLRQQLEDALAARDAALANDAADAQTIADAQAETARVLAEFDAQTADTAAAVTELGAIDPDPTA